MIFRINQNNTLPKLLYQCLNSSDQPVDLTGYTVTFTLIQQDRKKTIVFTGASGSLSQAGACYLPSNGWVEFQFSAVQTAESGFYYGRFDVTKDGKTGSYPNQLEKLEIYIEPGGYTEP